MRTLVLVFITFTILVGFITTYKAYSSETIIKDRLISSKPILVWGNKNVKVTPRGRLSEYTYQSGMQLDNGDCITVGKKSLAYILFPSNTLVVVLPLSNVQINNFELGRQEEILLKEGSLTVRNRDKSLINKFVINSAVSRVENVQFNQFHAHISYREDNSLLCANFSDNLQVKSNPELNNQTKEIAQDKYIEVNYNGRIGLLHSFDNQFQTLKENELKRTEMIPVGDDLTLILKNMKRIALPRRPNN